MTLYKLFGIALVISVLGMPARAESGREGITTAQIAAAIRDAGMDISVGQVALLSDVVAKTSTPVLRVESVGPWDGNITRVRLDCVTSDECLPFVVIVRRARKDDASVVSGPSGSQILKRSPVETPRSKVVVRSGSSAVLLLDGGHVHIQLAVVCLENGVIGQTIRVASRGHEHTYMAEVCSDGMLRGTL